jgi:hypothetical protein
MPTFSASVNIERARLARFAKAWTDATSDTQRQSAFGELERAINQLAVFADGTLIEAMIANAALTQHLLVIQSAVARAPTLERSLAERIEKTTRSIETMPLALANAIGVELQMFMAMNELIKREGFGDLGNRSFDVVARFSFEENDSLNRMAGLYREVQQQVKDVGLLDRRDLAMQKQSQDIGCSSWGEPGVLCLVFERNPAGKILTAIATPSFVQYGERVHDLRNLAAVTRVTVAAKRNAISSDKLPQFLASAPADMRNVFTNGAFVFEAASRQLVIPLKTNNTVLGEGRYTLSL